MLPNINSLDRRSGPQHNIVICFSIWSFCHNVNKISLKINLKYYEGDPVIKEIKRISDRNYGIGCDQLLIIERSNKKEIPNKNMYEGKP